MDNTVENNVQELSLDDAAQAPEEPQGESIETITEEPQQQEEQPKEPGWIRQRIDKAVDRALREQETRLRGEYEAMLAPIRESVLDRQAEDLVKQGEFKSLDMAKEYVRMKNGLPVQQQPVQQPVQQPAQDNPEVSVRAKMLMQQAHKIRDNRGVDVIGMYNSDPDVKQKILSGEWDFYDVADAMQKKTPPSPTRTPNGANYTANSVKDMTDAQFAKLQANLAGGRKYNLRK